jgi:hypothetical protein
VRSIGAAPKKSTAADPSGMEVLLGLQKGSTKKIMSCFLMVICWSFSGIAKKG